MLYPRLTNCPECANIPELLKRIDCRLAELGNSLYNNISYMLNQPIPAGDILQLIAYKRILMYKNVNPDYAYHYSISKIASKVILLTLGCESKPMYTPTVRVTTTTTTTPCPTTTTTTSSTTTTTTTLVIPQVTIGTQIWSSTNLDITTYRDGTPIPQVTDPTAWAALTTGAWCYYDNNSSNGTTYGKLYNWFAVNDIRGLAPTGYHIPSDTEWTTLTTFLGGESVSGGKMKSTGTSLWLAPNFGATNSSGFTGLPGGFRYFDGTFYNNGDFGSWWSFTGFNVTDSLARALDYNSAATINSNYDKSNGFSIRLIKD